MALDRQQRKHAWVTGSRVVTLFDSKLDYYFRGAQSIGPPRSVATFPGVAIWEKLINAHKFLRTNYGWEGPFVVTRERANLSHTRSWFKKTLKSQGVPKPTNQALGGFRANRWNVPSPRAIPIPTRIVLQTGFHTAPIGHAGVPQTTTTTVTQGTATDSWAALEGDRVRAGLQPPAPREWPWEWQARERVERANQQGNVLLQADLAEIERRAFESGLSEDAPRRPER